MAMRAQSGKETILRNFHIIIANRQYRLQSKLDIGIIM